MYHYQNHITTNVVQAARVADHKKKNRHFFFMNKLPKVRFHHFLRSSTCEWFLIFCVYFNFFSPLIVVGRKCACSATLRARSGSRLSTVFLPVQLARSPASRVPVRDRRSPSSPSGRRALRACHTFSSFFFFSFLVHSHSPLTPFPLILSPFNSPSVSGSFFFLSIPPQRWDTDRVQDGDLGNFFSSLIIFLFHVFFFVILQQTLSIL